jgi:hypothetical protein
MMAGRLSSEKCAGWWGGLATGMSTKAYYYRGDLTSSGVGLPDQATSCCART